MITDDGIRRRYAWGRRGTFASVLSADEQVPTVPTVIAGRYEVAGELGRGGMAEVRGGTDLRLRRPVAVKFLLP